jgi:hypothetical protein
MRLWKCKVNAPGMRKERIKKVSLTLYFILPIDKE